MFVLVIQDDLEDAHKLVNFSSSLLRVIYIPLFRSSLAFVNCNPDTNLLEADPSIGCGSREQNILQILAILSFIFFGFGIPFVLFCRVVVVKKYLPKMGTVSTDPCVLAVRFVKPYFGQLFSIFPFRVQYTTKQIQLLIYSFFFFFAQTEIYMKAVNPKLAIGESLS